MGMLHLGKDPLSKQLLQQPMSNCPNATRLHGKQQQQHIKINSSKIEMCVCVILEEMFIHEGK